MNKNVIMALLGTVMTTASPAQSTEVEAVKKTIMKFAIAAEYQDPAIMEEILEPNFRVVLNRLFGSEKLTVMDRATYIGKIRNKEFGGERREVSVTSVTINGHTAHALVSFKGTQLTFISTLLLVLDENGSWKLISDLPHVTS